MAKRITAKHERNLRYLAAFLATLSDNYMNFGMANYALFPRADSTRLFAEPIDLAKAGHTCGTVACAVGHAPLLGFQIRKDDSWDNIAGRLFGLDTLRSPTSMMWGWCFSGEWSDVDNTPLGAAKRIIWMLEASEDELVEAVTKFEEEVVYWTSKSHAKRWANKVYGAVKVPGFDTLPLDKLPSQAWRYATLAGRGEPLITVPA